MTINAIVVVGFEDKPGLNNEARAILTGTIKKGHAESPFSHVSTRTYAATKAAANDVLRAISKVAKLAKKHAADLNELSISVALTEGRKKKQKKGTTHRPKKPSTPGAAAA